ncbi:MAG TPA: acyl-CoA thioesterase [Methylomirabilota bacterium]|nr:acyl-CoA thioesterase [Methylomirabilota bacterium]
MPTIAQTTVEKIQWVFPEHAGAPGLIHGGRMMEWIVEAGTLAAARLARGMVALGAMDDIDFLHPVRVGEIAILRAQVEYVGRSSLEVGVRVWAENVVTGQRSVTLNSHLVFVSVGEDERPRPVRDRIVPADTAEARLVEEARQRREVRLARFAQHRERTQGERSRETQPRRTGNRPPSELSEQAAPATTIPAVASTFHFESVRPVLPEDVLFGSMMSAGKLLRQLDEAGGILSMRYCRGLVMTACVDAMDFYSPIHTHEVVIFKAGLNHVGTSSLEIGVTVLAEKAWTGEAREACTAFLTFVHLGPDLRPRPCPPFTPRTPAEQRRWDAALVRREQRLQRVKRLKAAILNDSSGERR